MFEFLKLLAENKVDLKTVIAPEGHIVCVFTDISEREIEQPTVCRVRVCSGDLYLSPDNFSLMYATPAIESIKRARRLLQGA